MKPKILLINPWIYDFAAANLWSRPLGLMEVAEFLSSYDCDMTFLDCLGTFKHRRYNMGKYPKKVLPRPGILKDVKRKYGRYGISTNEFLSIISEAGPFDIIFVTSIMTYWYPGVAKVTDICKDLYPETPIILGGIYATLHEEHASKHSGGDYVYTGKIDERVLTFFDKAGITISRNGNPKPYYKLGMQGSAGYASIMTSEGCPYKCRYCASGLLTGQFRFRDRETLCEDIEALYAMGVRDIAFYDDALLYKPDEHIKKILASVIEVGIKVRFHTPNGLHAKFIDDELAMLMRASGFKTIRLSLESVNRAIQDRLSGGKVTTHELSESVNCLKRAGFSKKELGVYVLYGLKGQEIDDVWESVRFLMDLDVRVNLCEFSPIPGTAVWDELIADGTFSGDIDPLLTNNTVYSQLFSGYHVSDIQELKDTVVRYNNIV
jgi:radical SAM superfamily enzyme YgiQ (UPF0313 family)